MQVEVQKMKQRYIPGIINLFEVTDPEEIKALANDPAVDRSFELRTCPVNWLLLKRSLSVLSYLGHRFPTMGPRQCPSRAHAQDKLWRKLDASTAEVKHGPVELTDLAEWVRGARPVDEVGLLTQQLLGRLFQSGFTATQESWSAALILVQAPRSTDIPKMLWWAITGKIRRAKRLLAESVNGDLSAVNAIGIAVHNVVKGLHHMRSLYADIGLRNELSPEKIADRCVGAPVSVYRQSTSPGTVKGRYFPKHSLFVLNIGVASRLKDGRSLVFMEDSWSRCPAATWIPAMLEGVWRRALQK